MVKLDGKVDIIVWQVRMLFGGASVVRYVVYLSCGVRSHGQQTVHENHGARDQSLVNCQ